MVSFLDFESPIRELQTRIDELRDTDTTVDIAPEIGRLEAKSQKLLRDTYARLTPWQKTQVARHPERPHLQGLHRRFRRRLSKPLAGDRAFADDQAIVGGLGAHRLGGKRDGDRS